MIGNMSPLPFSLTPSLSLLSSVSRLEQSLSSFPLPFLTLNSFVSLFLPLLLLLCWWQKASISRLEGSEGRKEGGRVGKLKERC